MGAICWFPEKLIKKFRVIYYEVSTDEEFKRSLKEATRTKRASLLIVAGHGVAKNLSFGAADPAREQLESEKKYLDVGDIEKMKGLEKTMVSGGKIVLISCSNGEGGRGANNVANFVANIFQNTTVESFKTSTRSFLKFCHNQTSKTPCVTLNIPDAIKYVVSPRKKTDK